VANYGDVALGLGPDWSRYKLNDQTFALGTVGHEGGVADVYLEDEPDQQHQFAWVDTRWRDEVSINRQKGYEFVNVNAGWVKSERLWDVDAEGFVVHNGQRLMARPFARFLEDMKARKTQRDRVMGTNKDEEAAIAAAARAGIDLTGDEGKPLRRKRA
jgi:hypothetical protein